MAELRRFQDRVSHRRVWRSGILLVPGHCRKQMPISISTWLSRLPWRPRYHGMPSPYRVLRS